MKHVEAVRNWSLDPDKTALLVVDFQNSELAENLFTQHPEYKAELNRALSHAGHLVDSMRERGCEIVYTVIEALTQDGRDVGLDHKLSNILVPKGSKLAEIPAQAKHQEDDIIISKTSSGVFNSTNIAYVLRNMGISNVVVCGLLTDQCVDMTIRDGADLGFYMICAHQACATRTKERHHNALAAFGGYCRVQDNADILANIQASVRP